MVIRLDRSRETVVVLCSSCPAWRSLQTDLAAAWVAGASHEASVHGAASDATRAGVAYVRRRA